MTTVISYAKRVRLKGNLKGRQSPKFAHFFNLRTKKPHQKILSFDEVMACQSSPFFGPLKNELKFSRGI